MPIPFRVSLQEPNTLAAVKEGYRLSDAAGVILSQGTTIEINPVCTAEASLTLGAIAGVLTVTDASGTAVPLAGGKITLQNNLGQTVAVTYTAEDEKIHVQGGDITFTPSSISCVRAIFFSESRGSNDGRTSPSSAERSTS